MIKATMRNPDANQVSRDDEVLVHVSKGNTSVWQELFTQYVQDYTFYERNASVIVSFAVYAERGIGFATAQMLTTGRFNLANKVTHHLRMLQSRFTPVMSPGSDLFVSAVSPIMAIGHKGTSAPSRAQMADDAVHVAWQEILTRVGGRRSVVPTVCLLTALAACISMSVALLQRKARSKRRYAPLMAERLFNIHHEHDSRDISCDSRGL